MQRLQLNPDEKITRKEYLKRKRKQIKDFSPKKRKHIYLILLFFLILISYVSVQVYIYSKSNSFKYIEGEDIGKQKVYNVYYVTEGYTYDPVYTLNNINSDGFGDKVVYSNSGMHSIQVNKEFVFGIKNSSLCKLDKATSVIEVLIEKDVQKYTLKGNKIYYITMENKLCVIDVNTKETKDLGISNVSEIEIDDTNIFTVIDEKLKKIIAKYDLDGKNKTVLTKNSNVSYIIQDENNLYYVNKADGNKIYSVTKNGGNESCVADIKSVADNGDIKEIDGSKNMFINGNNLFYINTSDDNSLWKINLATKQNNERVIAVPIQILQNVDETVFYKVKGEMGVYLYNYNTGFMSQITRRKVKEFIIDKDGKIDSNAEGNFDKN